MLKIMFSAGEASGDMQAAGVAKAVLNLHPDAYLFGMGGSMMREAGVHITHDITDLGIVGLVEVLKNLRRLFRLKRELTELLKKERPDVFVIVDYPGFNIRMAKVAKSLGIKVVSYIGPQIWAWGAWRAEGIAQAVDHITSIFPFEAKLYADAGATVTCVGHPLLDIVKPDADKDSIRKRYNVAEMNPVVLLLPGSRPQEISKMLPVMLDAAREIKKRVASCQFFMPCATTIDREWLNSFTENSIELPEVRIVEQTESYNLMSVADVAIATSGTVTLEAAILGLPSVIVYKVNALTYFLGKYLVKIPNVGLPNIVAGKRVLPELLQDDVKYDIIADKVCEFLLQESRMKVVREELGVVKKTLGEKGAVERVARIIAELGMDVRKARCEIKE